MHATATEETVNGVPGVRFSTDARPDSTQEGLLQEIQRELAGITILPTDTTLPHLALYEVEIVDAPSESRISLWVPTDTRSDAVERLRAAGFTVS